jgi:hypothetical protein
MSTASEAATRSRLLVWLYRVTVVGVVVHELAHQFVAELFDLEVREVDYTSHVEHEVPRTLLQAVLVAVAPLVVNTALGVGVLFVLAGAVPFEPGQLELAWPTAVALFVTFSLFFRAIPSVQDLANVFRATRRLARWYRPQVLVGALLLAPFLVPFYVALRVAKATGTRVVVDLGYATLAFLVVAEVVPLAVPPSF